MKKWFIGYIFLLFSMYLYGKNIQILNVSYDPTREFYEEYNKMFSIYYNKKTGSNIIIRQSHGGSGTQAMSVINGIKADVVTLALASDINTISKHGRIKKNWIKRFPNHSSPYNSTIVFLVRKGNPKNIQDWNDLIKSNISIITPNPKSSGGARWNYLAAWGYALLKNKNNNEKAKEFVRDIFKNVEVQDSGSRGATNTFFERGIGDVLISWENEAYFFLEKLGKKNYEIITPSISILTEPVVTVVDKIVDIRNTRKISNDYLQYLYSKEAQKIAEKYFYRSFNLNISKRSPKIIFPPIKFFTIHNIFQGWESAQKIHFSEGGTYDQIMMQLIK